jgi:hypothetical protein
LAKLKGIILKDNTSGNKTKAKAQRLRNLGEIRPSKGKLNAPNMGINTIDKI